MPAKPSGDWVEVDEVGAATVVRVNHAWLWEDADVRALACCLAGVLDLAGRRTLVLDLSGVECLSSSAVGAIVGLHGRARRRGVRVAVCGLAGQPAQVFETLRLARLLSVGGAPEEVVSACGDC
jgi:anti-anti-sigma factor